jgi:hypothetical protein
MLAEPVRLLRVLKKGGSVYLVLGHKVCEIIANFYRTKKIEVEVETKKVY